MRSFIKQFSKTHNQLTSLSDSIINTQTYPRERLQKINKSKCDNNRLANVSIFLGFTPEIWCWLCGDMSTYLNKDKKEDIGCYKFTLYLYEDGPHNEMK